MITLKGNLQQSKELGGLSAALFTDRIFRLPSRMFLRKPGLNFPESFVEISAYLWQIRVLSDIVGQVIDRFIGFIKI